MKVILKGYMQNYIYTVFIYILRVLELELLTCHIIGLLVALGLRLINNHSVMSVRQLLFEQFKNKK